MEEHAQEGPRAAIHRVDRLLLAAWLRLNKLQVVARELLPEGRVVYCFEPSEEFDRLVAHWCAKTSETGRLVSFARIVRHEIHVAIRLRRQRIMEERAMNDLDAIAQQP